MEHRIVVLFFNTSMNYNFQRYCEHCSYIGDLDTIKIRDYSTQKVLSTKIMTYRTSRTTTISTPARVSYQIYLGEDFDPNSGFCEYEIIREIGEGGFGRVLLAIHKNTHESVAIKVMKADKITSAQSIDQIFREVENLKAVRHPNIVKIHNCYALQGMQIVMIMEYLEGG
jgi:hypothetical protein